MKPFPFLLFPILLPLFMEGQELHGTFKDNTSEYRKEYIRFDGDTASFSFDTRGCLVYQYEASGRFEVYRKHLVIHPYIETPPANITKAEQLKNDSTGIEVSTVDSQVISPSLIVYDSKRNESIGQVISSNKTFFVPGRYLANPDSVKVAYLDYIPVQYKIDKGYKYKIVLQKGKIKSEYEQFLQTNKGGLKIKIKKDSILLYRPKFPCSSKGGNYFWQTFVRS